MLLFFTICATNQQGHPYYKNYLCPQFPGPNVPGFGGWVVWFQCRTEQLMEIIYFQVCPFKIQLIVLGESVSYHHYPFFSKVVQKANHEPLAYPPHSLPVCL